MRINFAMQLSLIHICISGNASSMNFDGTVSYGTSAATLVSNGWVDVGWYKTTAGDAAAYSKDVDNATIIAFADAYGDDRVYSIQIFNNAYSIADMTPVSYTHLDVYKRQLSHQYRRFMCRRTI